MLSVNETYKSRDELLDAFSSFMEREKHKFILKERRKAISLICKARKDCYCDAQITACFKKRENVFQIKKAKTAHKCPLEYHFYPNFLEEEIKRKSGSLLGENIKKMNENGIKIGYLTAWKIVNKDFVKNSTKNTNDNTEYAGGNGNVVNFRSAEDRHGTTENKSNIAADIEENSIGYNSFNSLNNICDGSNVIRSSREDQIRNAIVESGNAFYLDEESECSDESETIINEALKGFKNEFLLRNPSSHCEVGDSMIYISFPFLKYLRNVLEIKIYMRKKGCVVYGVGYDPVDKPIILSFVTSNNDVESTMKFFFENEPRFYNLDEKITDSEETIKKVTKKRKILDEKSMKMTGHEVEGIKNSNEPILITYLTEYDEKIVEVLERLKVNYFVKTRSICKRFGLSDTERIFNIINYNKGDVLEDIKLDTSRYIAKGGLFGINNFSEVDLDFIFYAIYNFCLFDCMISILKLSSDNLKERIYRSFGDNVLFKLERNKKIGTNLSSECQVDLDNFWCSCGKYQTFLIPCPHACSLIIQQGKDPLEFVSRVYDPEIINLFEQIHPVVDVPVKCQLDRFLLRRGPGRPKKHNLVADKR